MRIGVVRAIYRYPVKSLRGESLERCDVLERGLAGDRTAALIGGDGNWSAGKPYRGKEDNRLHVIASADEALALDPGLELAYDDEGEFFDAAPVSLLLDRWLDDLCEHLGYRAEFQRFRPNFFVEAAAGVSIDEAALVGHELQLGDVTLRVREPIERCAVPSYDLTTGESDPRVLRFLVQQRANEMGVYCDVLRAGTVRTGDSLELIEC
ncbi:MAG TPA: MOSC domain-containing protein [Candidatus Acidoferrales bacterium]|nr:MOSC domain-containing protein [Candidatus Acidoferrales bacterium]